MPEYRVRTQFLFDGVFTITADSQAQAVEFAEKHCGFTIDRGIHSSLADEDVDWDFPTHPLKTIVGVDGDETVADDNDCDKWGTKNETSVIKQAGASAVLGALADAVGSREKFTEQIARRYLNDMGGDAAWDQFGGPPVDNLEDALIEEFGDPDDEDEDESKS